MLKKQIERLTNVLIEKGISKPEDKEIVIFGLCTGIELFLNIITTIMLGLLFGMIFESILFLISFSFIRTYAGGYHCKKAISCYFLSSGIVVLVLSIVKFTPIGYILGISLIMLLISVPIISKLAPVETETKPLNEVERNYFKKKTILYLCVECVVITTLFLFKLYILGYIICLGITVSAILILFGKTKFRRILLCLK